MKIFIKFFLLVPDAFLCYSAKMPVLSVFSPAKINLHLAVLDKRPDGFHNLDSLFVAVDFGDTLLFNQLEEENLVDFSIKGINLNIPAEKNLIIRALTLYKAKTGFKKGLKIEVNKRIPIGGGLGGGSSNAAVTLLALNKMAASVLSRAELLEMAASLGSDVPFFVYETAAARVTGRGEHIEPLEAPAMHFVIVKPDFGSDTAAAYRMLDEYREKFPVNHDKGQGSELGNLNRLIAKHDNEQRPLSPMQRCCTPCTLSLFKNDFLPVFPEPEKAVYDEIISRLQEQGAEYAGLSGAGSACFGIFKKKEAAAKARASMRGKWNFIECCGINR